MKFLGVAVLALGLVTVSACGKNKSEPSAVVKPGVVSLKGKKVEEVLALKYLKAELNCELRTQAGSSFNPSAIPTAQVTWNLLKDFASPRKFELRGSAGPNHSFKMDLVVTDVRIDSSSQYRDADGTVYKMEHSPTVEMTYHYEDSLQLSPGVSGQGAGEGARSVHERILDHVLSMSESDSSATPRVEYFTEVRCILDTEARPEYSGQFLVKKSK